MRGRTVARHVTAKHPVRSSRFDAAIKPLRSIAFIEVALRLLVLRHKRCLSAQQGHKQFENDDGSDQCATRACLTNPNPLRNYEAGGFYRQYVRRHFQFMQPLYDPIEDLNRFVRHALAGYNIFGRGREVHSNRQVKPLRSE